MKKKTRTAAAILLMAFGCNPPQRATGSDNSQNDNSKSDGTGTATATATDSSTGTATDTGTDTGIDNSGNTCGTNLDQANCSCNVGGATRACFTGAAADRTKSGCHDGTQTCVFSGEFASWSDCTGDQPTCAPSFGTGFDDDVNGIDVTATAVYWVGNFTHYNGMSTVRVAETDLQGTLSSTFLPGTGFDISPSGVAAVKDGGIVLFDSSSAMRYQGLANAGPTLKLRSDATVDTNWSPPSPMAASGSNQTLVARALDNMVAVLTWQTLRILDLNGTVLFTANGDVNMHSLLVLGKKLGLSQRYNSQYNGILTPHGFKVLDFSGTPGSSGFGAVDTTYLSNAGTGSNSSCGLAAADATGTQIVIGTTTQWDGSAYAWNGGAATNGHMYNIKVAGTAIPGWNTNISLQGNGDSAPCGIDSQGRVYLTGDVQSVNGVATANLNRLYRLTATGALDKEFTGFNNNVNGCHLFGDDQILTFGKFTSYNNVAVGRTVTVHADGTSY